MLVKKFLIIIFFFSLFPISAGAQTPVKILLVPGHDDKVWGAQYGDMKEANMTIALATRIYNILEKDERLEIYITRDNAGYKKDFADYFSSNWEDISVFKKNAKVEMLQKILDGIFVKKVNHPHSKVSEDVSIKLYGLNKWANEHKINAVVHVHFNDYPRPNGWTIGKHTGFAIYFPDEELSNSRESFQLALDIFTQLRKKYKTSTYEKETGGLISDQELIALGANATLDADVPSVLVEYGYIYEKKFRVKSTRLQAYKNMAELTATGIQNYFFP